MVGRSLSRSAFNNFGLNRDEYPCQPGLPGLLTGKQEVTELLPVCRRYGSYGVVAQAEESTVEGQTLRRQAAISPVTRITLTTAQKSPILAANSFVMIISF